jgi:Sulfotransferase domain
MNATTLLTRSRAPQERRAAAIRAQIERATTVALSFPKAGRSWVCFFLAQYVAQRTGDLLDLDLLVEGRELPPTAFLHEHIDVFEDIVGPARLLNERLLLRRRLMVLVRDPRDTLVSYWYQKRVREARPVPARLQEFADSPVYGIERISHGTNLLLDLYDSHPGDRLSVSYERLVEDPAAGLRRVLRFALDGQPVDETSFRKALERSSFQAMRDWERRLTPRDAARYAERFGPRQVGQLTDGHFKVRRGRMGAFKTEMPPELQSYVEGLPHTAALLKRLAVADAAI